MAEDTETTTRFREWCYMCKNRRRIDHWHLTAAGERRIMPAPCPACRPAENKQGAA